MRDKKAQFNFVWLFAIIAGAAILFLAIYGATKLGETSNYQTGSQVAKKISVITDPLQAGFGEGAFGQISFRQETRINNICIDDREFGTNEISVSVKSGVGEKWNSPGVPTSIHNKYIFSKERSQGFEYYVFSKPFDFPYKVSDLIFMTSENYCFIGAPTKIKNEIEGLNIPNIDIDVCNSSEATRVCFGPGLNNCDIIVSGTCSGNCDSVFDEGTVITGSDDMKYVGSLMYAAIFSEKAIYECNVKRLLYRDSRIAEEFIYKTELMGARDCDSNMRGKLAIWMDVLANSTSNNLFALNSMAESLERDNRREACRVWN